MHTQDKQLIALDLDGTLLNDNKTISSQNLNELNHVLKTQNEVMIATAKTYSNTKKIATNLNIKNYSAFNGALNVINNEITYKQLINKEQYDFSVNWLKEILVRNNLKYENTYGYFVLHGLIKKYYVAFNDKSKSLKVTNLNDSIDTFDPNHDFFTTNEIFSISVFVGNKLPILDLHHKQYEINTPLVPQFPTDPQLAIPLLINGKKIIDQPINKLMQTFHISYVYNVLFTFSNKLFSVEQTRAYFNINRDDVVFIGDSLNDKQTLTYYPNSLLMSIHHHNLNTLTNKQIPTVDFFLKKQPLSIQLFSNNGRISLLINDLILQYGTSLPFHMLNDIKHVYLLNPSLKMSAGYESDKNLLTLDSFYQYEANDTSDYSLDNLIPENENIQVIRTYVLKDANKNNLNSQGILFQYHYNLVLYIPEGFTLNHVDIAYIANKDKYGQVKYKLYNYYDLMHDPELLNKVNFFDYYFLDNVYSNEIIEHKMQELQAINDEASKIYYDKLAAIQKDHLSYERNSKILKLISSYINHNKIHKTNKVQIYLMNVNPKLLDLNKIINYWQQSNDMSVHISSGYGTTQIKNKKSTQ